MTALGRHIQVIRNGSAEARLSSECCALKLSTYQMRADSGFLNVRDSPELRNLGDGC